MNDKEFSLDDILTEVGFSSASDENVDVDTLLKDLNPEKKEEISIEPPTKEFTPAKQPSESKIVYEVKKVFNKAENPPAQLENSGPISIDVDSIRKEQKPLKPIPVEKEDESLNTPEIHFNMAKEDPDFDRRLEIAPTFKKLVDKINLSSPEEFENIIAHEKSSNLLRGIFLTILSLISLLISMLIYSNATLEIEKIPSRFFLLIPGIIGVLSAILGLPTFISGFKSIKKMEPDRDIVPTVAFSFCVLQYITQFIFPKGLVNANIHQYLPVGILILAISFFAKNMICKTALNNRKILKTITQKNEAQIIWDNRAATEFAKGLTDETAYPVVNRKVEEISDFSELSFSMDASDRLGRDVTLFGAAFSLVIALFVFLFTMQQHLALTVMTAFICIFASVLNLYSVCYPLFRSSKIASLFNASVCGEKSGVEYGDVNVLVTTADKLFTPDAVVLNGIKTFEGMRIDEAILDAASVLNGADSILTGTFLKIIAGKTELLSKAENLHYEDGMGLSAWIGNRRILIGNRELMSSHNIRVPSLDYESRFNLEGSDLVYLSAQGELTAVFIFSLQPTYATEEAIRMLYNSDIALTIKTSDSIITKERLSQLFGIHPDYFKILPTKFNKLYNECSQFVKIRPAISINDGSFTSMSCAVSLAKRIKIMTKLAFVVTLCSVILGALLIAVFGFLNATKQLTPLLMFCYPIMWIFIHFLLQKTIRI